MQLTLGTVCRLLWIGKVEGKQNIPKEGGVILAPNHQGWFDFCFIAAVLKRRLYFLIGEFAYKVKIEAWAFNQMGHIRVNRHEKDQSHVYTEAKKKLDAGDVLVVFPEGRMTRDGKLQQAHKGVAKMALASKVDIVPVAIESFHVYPYHRKKQGPKLGARCSIKFLEPIRYETFKDMTPSEIVCTLLMPAIAKELEEEYTFQELGFEKIS